uniref:Uncharacterized protein n=1 Tax=Cynoglossus semilaevis TaxID=244447 RepID=A0A3P8VC77_CYNSE
GAQETDSHARVLVSMRPFLTTRAKSEVTANSPHSTPLKGLCDIQTWNQTSAIQLMWRNRSTVEDSAVFISCGTMGNCSGPKTRRLFLSSFFFFFFFLFLFGIAWR